MKKPLFVLCLVLTLIFSCAGCKKEYPFLQEKDDIESIKIVLVNSWNVETAGMEYDDTVIFEVENTRDFLKDFQNVERYTVFEPYRPQPTPIAIRFTYDDGSYESMYPNGTFNVRGFNGTWELNKSEFYTLISQYSTQKQIKKDYSFLYSKEEMSKIEIVEFENTDKYSMPKTKTVLYETENIDDFLAKFSEIDCYVNLNLPKKIDTNSTGIKITYLDGLFEYIDIFAQSKGFDNGTSYGGNYIFDPCQFEDFIRKKIGDSSGT